MMRLKRLTRCVVLALLTLAALAAAEYHGQVKFAGLPLPGVTITATKGDKVLAAVTDQQGAFSFADVPEGAWSLQVYKPGFIPIGQDVTAGSSLPGPSFELKMLPLDEMQTVSPSAAPEQTTTIAPAPTVP